MTQEMGGPSSRSRYGVGAAAVAAASTFGTEAANAISKGANGAQGATTPEQSRFDAAGGLGELPRAPSRTTKGAPLWVVGVLVVVIVVVLVKS